MQTSKVNKRVASVEDRCAIIQLVVTNHLALSQSEPEEWVSQLLDIPDDFKSLLEESTFASGHFEVAVDESSGRVVGAAGCVPGGGVPAAADTEGTWTVTAVSVSPEYRRRGLAQELLKRVIDWAVEQRCITKLELVTLLELMEPAWRLYEKLGFKRDKEVPATDGARPREVTVLYYSREVLEE